MKEFLEALPIAATSPLAFIAYLVTLFAWTIIALRTRRIASILHSIKAIPKEDRKELLEAEMGVKLPK